MVASESSTAAASVYSGQTGHKEADLKDDTPAAPEYVSEKQVDAEQNAQAAAAGGDAAGAGSKELGATGVVADDGSTKDATTEEQDEEEEYPAAWKLGLITIALCLSVFCMALVSRQALLSFLFAIARYDGFC